MKTVQWNDPIIQNGLLEKPVRVYQPRAYCSSYYTAIPMELLDSIRAMLYGKGLKVRTFYAGPRTRPFQVTTNKADARYAKLLVTDPKTKRRAYL